MSERSNDLSALFVEAVELPTAEARQRFVESCCGDDDQLREQLFVLLRAHEQAGQFLADPPAEFVGDPTEFHNSSDGGPVRKSVLELIGQTVAAELPRVVLDSSPEEGAGPIVRPKSTEVPIQSTDSKYRLDGEIARGGMGAILKGRDTDLGRDLAVKVLLDEHREKPAVIQRFVEEAQIGGQLQHPGIVPVYEIGQFEDQRPFFTMKLVKGKTLSALLGERSSPQEDRAKFLGIFEQICQTVAYAHARGVIHRDLKPSNVMVGAFGEVQVMDWGLAKVLSEGGVADEQRQFDNRTRTSIIQTIRSLGSDTPASIGSATAGSHTQMGSVLGTPAYMPPEQALGEIDRLDQRSDVFGLGAILVEILTGDPPYVGKDHTDVFRKASRAKLEECFERLSKQHVDDELIQIVRDTLHPEPEDRIRDAGLLTERIGGHLASIETRMRDAELAKVEANTRTAEERKRRKVMMALAASILLTFSVAGGGWMWVQSKNHALSQAESQAKLEAQVQQSRLDQQISGELSTARVLGALDAEELPESSAIGRALAAAQRAESLLEPGDVDEALTQTIGRTRAELESLQRDFTLVAALEAAWDDEREYHAAKKRWESSASQRHGFANLPTGVSSPRDDVPELLAVEHPSMAYQRAFAEWGLSLDAGSVDEATEKLQALDATFQPIAMVSLNRWRHLLTQPRTIEQWQDIQWKTLKPVELKSRGRDQLSVLEDQSILASGPTPWFGYDLTFETDEKEISALRLEAMLHDSLPFRGPGRNLQGSFAIGRLRVHYAERATPDQITELEFTNVIADYESPIWPIHYPFLEWSTSGGGGKPHVAVVIPDAPIQSQSGFVITISHWDRRHPAPGELDNLGRFRWSVTPSAGNTSSAQTLTEVIQRTNPDEWVQDMWSEVEQGKVVELAKRASDLDALSNQPTEVVSRLATTLQTFDGQQLFDLIPEGVIWEPFEAEHISSEGGATLTRLDDGKVHISGVNPPADEIELHGSLKGECPTAILLDLIPARVNPASADGQKGGGSIGTSGARSVWFREIVVVARDPTHDGQGILLKPKIATVEQRDVQPLAHAFDDDLMTHSPLPWPQKSRQLILFLPPFDVTAETELWIRIATGPSHHNMRRFRVSLTTDELEIPDVNGTALKVLESLNDRDPSDYWTRLALADCLLRQMPPDHEGALRHAAAAVALRPNATGGHAAILRSLPVGEINDTSSHGRLAISHAAQLRRLDPAHPAIDDVVSQLVSRADQHFEAEDSDAAQQAAKFAIRLRSANTQTYVELAFSLLKRGQSTLAELSAQAAREIDPDAPVVLGALGYVHLILGNDDLALEYFQKWTEADPTSVYGYSNLAFVHDVRKEFTEAVTVMRQAIQVNPLDASAHNFLGYALAQNKKPKEAIEAYRRAVELLPYNLAFRRNLSNKLRNEQRADEAISLWEDLIEIDPGNSVPMNDLQQLLYREGRLDEAIELLERVVKLKPEDVSACDWLTYYYRLVGRIEDGKQVFLNTLKLNDSNSFLYLRFADYLKEVEDFEEAIEMYRVSIKLGPKRTDHYFNLAKLLTKLGRNDEAIDVYRERIKHQPRIADSYKLLGDLLWEEDRYHEARPIFQRALKDQPDNVFLLDWIARSLATRPDCSKEDGQWAVELATKARRLKPDGIGILLTLAIAEHRAGNSGQAIQMHQEYVERIIEDELNRENASFNLFFAQARCYQAMAAFESKQQEKARRWLDEAEGALGHLAFVEQPEFEDNQNTAAEVIDVLREVRQVLGESAEFSRKKRVENALNAHTNYLESYPNDAQQTMELLSLLAWFDRKQEWHELAHKALDRLTDPNRDDDTHAYTRIARGCLSITTDDEELMAKAIAAARRPLTQGDENLNQRFHELNTLGIAEFRQGNYPRAEELLTKVVNWAPSGRLMGDHARLFRCMARYQQGDEEGALADLEAVEQRILPLPPRDELPRERYASNVAFVVLAYEEAKAMLGGN